MVRKRLTSLLLVSPLIFGLCVAAYRFGSSRSGKAEQLLTSTPADLKSGKGAEAQPASSRLFEFLGMHETAVAKGRVQMTPAEYLNSVEALYQQRGYQKLDVNAQPRKKKRKSGVALPKQSVGTKFFQREEANGIGSISAMGNDADYSTDRQSPEPFSFSTLVAPSENGGAEWATYRMEIDRSKLAQLGNLEHGDFPGTDPANIPRLPGLQRIYALTSANGSIAIYKSREAETSLMVHYLDEMPRYGWRLDPDVTSNGNNAARGVMYFTRAARFCMIWITTDKETGTTSITIGSY